MPKRKEKIVELCLNSKIKYTYRTPHLGRAEFEICPVFKRGYIEKVYIYRAQQYEEQSAYVLDLKKLGLRRTNTFDITAWGHLTDEPRVWRNYWCKEHKAICFETYVPNGTDIIEFDYHFGNSLTIRFVKSGRD